MKSLFSFILVLALNYVIHSQIMIITDMETNKPIEFVEIINIANQLQVFSNINGEADISSFKHTNEVTIKAIGYKTMVKSYAQLQALGFSVSLTQANITMNEIVVTATRWNQSNKNTPSKITSITNKEVILQNPQTAADLLGSSGEVFIQKSQQGGGSPMIRGFSANRLLYVIDGVRMNTAIFRAGNIQNVISLDPFAIEKTEVLFGPGSTTYGSDAIGGVMNFRTLTPGFSDSDKYMLSGSAKTRYSSANNEKTAHFDIGVGWKKWASVTSISSHNFGDLRMGSKGPHEYLRTFYVQNTDSVDQIINNENPLVQRPTRYQQINLMQKIRFSPSEKWEIDYAFHYSETSPFARYDRLIEVTSDGQPQSAFWNYGPQKWLMNQVNVSHKSKSKIYDNLSLRLAYQNFEESRIDRNFSGGNRFRLRTQKEEVMAYSFNLDLEKSFGKSQVYYGAEAIQNDVNSLATAINIQTKVEIPTPDRYPASTWQSIAAYLNFQHKLSTQILLLTGTRYSRYYINADFLRIIPFFPFDFTEVNIQNGALTGSLGIVYSPDETWKISINASTGFRAPNVDDVGKIFDFVPGDVILPNPDLRSEYAYNGEINISKVFGDRLKFDLTGFYTHLENAMVRRSIQISGQDSILYNGIMSKAFSIQNTAKAHVYGFHFGFELGLGEGFKLLSRYNYQLGKEETDNGEVGRSRHAAPAFGVSRLTYSKNKLELQFYAMYNAEVSFKNLNVEERQKPIIYAKDEDGMPFSPSWSTLNFKALYQIGKHLSISAGLENLLDKRYRPFSSGIVAAGRNFILSANCKF